MHIQCYFLLYVYVELYDQTQWIIITVMQSSLKVPNV